MVHPKAEQIVHWLQSQSNGTAHGTLLHVLQCTECRERALAELREQHSSAGLADILHYRPQAETLPLACADPTAREEDLAARFGRVYARALARAELEMRRAETLFGELVTHPAPRREVLVRNSERFRSLALAQKILEASRETSFDDALEGERLASLALVVLDTADSDLYGHRLLDDLRARGFAYLGNARRLANDLAGADRAFDEGLSYLEDTSDPVEEAGFLHLLASLRKLQRRFDESADLLQQASELYAEVGDSEKLARVLTTLGSQYIDKGCPEEAEEALVEALRHVDPLADPRTALYIQHNLTLCLAETGRYLEAQRMFRSTQALYERFPDRVTRLRARWLEGILAAGTGRPDDAEEILSRVQVEFAARELPYDAALVGLERAALYARLGRNAELRQLALELAPAFFSYGLRRDAMAAVTFFVQAAQRDNATLDTIRQVTRFLKRSRHDPKARFEPATAGT